MNKMVPTILTALGKSPQQREKMEQQQRQEEKSITRTMMPLVCGVCVGGGGGRGEEGRENDVSVCSVHMRMHTILRLPTS